MCHKDFSKMAQSGHSGNSCRLKFPELTPLNKEDVDRQLDFRELKLASKEAEFKTFNDVDADGHSSDDDASKNDVSCFKRNRRKKSDFDPAPKMNTFVGFLRLANYVNACCVIFGVILSIFLHDLDLEENDLDREKRNFGNFLIIIIWLDLSASSVRGLSLLIKWKQC